ncbi:MAG TPA: hemerythrin domain-containing protein [Polyangiaceae bacterium]|nr:hemerythrin domain-containing protein [Polyangiaceae bacterium]
MLVNIGRRSAPEAQDLVGLLLECHERIRRFTSIAQRVAERRDLPDPEVIDACERVDRYFRQALPLHVEDEEQSLLPRIRGVQADLDRALATLQAQHASQEPLIEALLAALTSVRTAPGDAGARDALASIAGRLAEEFEAHLKLEETVVFPYVRRDLPAEAQAQIVAELRARRHATL